MKKLVSIIMALLMVCTMSVTAFAAEEIPDEAISVTENGVAPASVLSISFSSLTAGSRKLSSEVYYIEDEDAKINISSATWSPASQNIWIGWYNVDTGVEYYVEYSGGEISDRGITAKGLPDGDYKIFVKNVGTRAVTSPQDMVIHCTWLSAARTVYIGFMNVASEDVYTISAVGGTLSGTLSLDDLPDGEYKVIMYSSDNENIHAVMLYQFHNN